MYKKMKKKKKKTNKIIVLSGLVRDIVIIDERLVTVNNS